MIEGLNREQKIAVTHGTGPLLIIAGAGTGKTKVITHRIAYLVSNKTARPEEILAVTFTEKAANEMEERVDRLIPYSYSFVEISTFNSFGEKILRNYGHEIGIPPDFRLLDEIEQAIFFRERLFQFPLEYYRPLSSPTRFIMEILAAIKRLKQEDVKTDEYLKYAEQLCQTASNDIEKDLARKHREIALVYQKYQQLLRDEGRIDFDDQVTLVVSLFRKRPSILHEFQTRFKYILVDEFQDTNYIQFELLKLLSSGHENLTVVGDDDQSIFRFRGASLSNIRSFRDIYPEYKKVVLNKNYRSTQAILDSAYRLIQFNNPDRLEVQEKIDKTLEAVEKSSRKSIHLLQFDTISHEADRVAEIILEKVKKGAQFGEFAILVRRNADADPFLRSLNMKEIPFRFSGSRGLYSKEEVKVLISFIKALTDFEESRSLYYLALSEVYGVAPYDLTALTNFASKKHRTLHVVFEMVSRGKPPAAISTSSEMKIKALFEDLLFFVKLAASQNAGRVLYSFLEKSGYLKSLLEEGGVSSEIKIKNIRNFFDKVKNFSDIAQDDSIFSFAKHLELLQQVGDDPASAEAELEEDAVQVLTVHKAKGLEFPVVFMVGLIADRFPGRMRREKIPAPDVLLKEDLPEKENIMQEERRLFYVGMTRAKKDLYLTFARDYGLKRLKKVTPFIKEALDLPQMPDEVLRTTGLEEIKRHAHEASFSVKDRKKSIKGMLKLSFFQVDYYHTCPLKYRYKHIIRIPEIPHHNVVFGRILHNTIYDFLRKKKSGRDLTLSGLLLEYENRWVSEGFISREHEEMRKAAGMEALKMFYENEMESRQMPEYLEREFKWKSGEVLFRGRWDRVDYTEEGAVIIDFKATSVRDQKEADNRVKKSDQMNLYALSFLKTQDVPLLETRLHFLESGHIGRAAKGDKELDKAMVLIEEVEQGIRRQDFAAKPDWHHCSYCEYKTICPSSYAY